jgi:multidrug resistance efflux pump
LTILALAFATVSCHRSSSEAVVSGTIEIDEAHVASRYGGRVEKILAQEGDSLKPGQVLVELDAAELETRRNQADATLAELVAGPRKGDIDAAKNDLQAMQSDLELARSDAKRAIELYLQKTISDTERDRAVSRANTLEKNVAAAKNRYDLLVEGTRPERIALARAQLAEIDTQLREMKIAAPTNCILEVLSVKLGDVLAPNREVATLVFTQHLWARVFVSESWLGRIHLGETVKVRVDSFANEDFEGTVEQINRSAEFTPRNVQTVDERIKQVFGVKVRLKNDADKLRAGMSADVTFPDAAK